MSKGRKNCLCTAMLYDPNDQPKPEETAKDFKKKSKIYERFMRAKKNRLYQYLKKKKLEKPKSIFSLFFNL
jgi:hypothetical protein